MDFTSCHRNEGGTTSRFEVRIWLRFLKKLFSLDVGHKTLFHGLILVSLVIWHSSLCFQKMIKVLDLSNP